MAHLPTFSHSPGSLPVAIPGEFSKSSVADPIKKRAVLKYISGLLTNFVIGGGAVTGKMGSEFFRGFFESRF